ALRGRPRPRAAGGAPARAGGAARRLLSGAAEGRPVSALRTILWVGRGDAFPAQVADSPLLDVVFERDLEAALALPLAGFDACGLDAHEPELALAQVRRLRARRGCPPLLVRLERAEGGVAELAAAGAAEVVPGGAGDGTGVEVLARLERLVRPP